ncbi:phytoene/squalene synthase family protein [Actinocatenispora rupis]|uniref:Phytoene synthase n=1 Tax=Actinocatenispora rupis TaxID=519421 RepID=A0A8J3JCR5_9ACTN|nr:phytoene/squalene synthase family protein [Actinocatenispora rupis]GID14334.1 phytoene synthase [Actinocatenispora rupis]
MVDAGEPLAAAYARCRSLHRRHGRTYYLATRLLPAWKRRHVHALYGFSRYADDLVDGHGSTAAKTAALGEYAGRFVAGLGGEMRPDPVLPAVLHTIRVFDLDVADFDAFLASMAMDLTVTDYPTYAELCRYMAGSAAAIGSMMLPILGTERVAVGEAREAARALGLAFQLTNFIRDVREDLARGRVYLPGEDLARFGVTRADLAAPVAGPAVRALVEFEVRRAHGLYEAAAPGVAMLSRTARPCIRAAFTLYRGILDEVARAGYDVLGRRATVPNRRRAAVAARELVALAW